MKDLIVHAIAQRIAKRENGEGYVGYESTHVEAARDYADAAQKALKQAGHFICKMEGGTHTGACPTCGCEIVAP